MCGRIHGPGYLQNEFWGGMHDTFDCMSTTRDENILWKETVLKSQMNYIGRAAWIRAGDRSGRRRTKNRDSDIIVGGQLGEQCRIHHLETGVGYTVRLYQASDGLPQQTFEIVCQSLPAAYLGSRHVYSSSLHPVALAETFHIGSCRERTPSI